jgi:hypothetical protein
MRALAIPNLGLSQNQVDELISYFAAEIDIASCRNNGDPKIA